MRHDIQLAGAVFGLRPVTAGDAEFIVALRGDASLNAFINSTSPHVEDQVAWIERYEQRAGDFYFVVERLSDHSAEGLIGIYDIADGEGEWGRWILRSGSLAAVESAGLIYRCAFERIGLDAVVCRTVAANERVVSFHDSCGIAERRVLPSHVELRGQRWDVVEHRLSREAWPAVDARLTHLARLIARRHARGTA
jgi:RimJ/RimL family protein N-acetyltransferase